MRRLKWPLTVLLFLLLLVDSAMGFKLWESGWPKRVTLTDVQPGTVDIEVIPIPFRGVDWLILVVLVAVHAALFYVAWKAWRTVPSRG